MYIKRFRAENFRNIESCEIDFYPGVNVLSGKNAQGKTNALEGIYYFARGKSFRAAKDADMVRFGENGFSIGISYHGDGRDQTLSYELTEGTRTRHRNGVRLSKLSDMIGSFRAVLFHPEHLQIIKAGPDGRRELLNVAISQSDKSYLYFCTEYNKILENRNYLLKTAQKGGYVDQNELLAWGEKMAEVATAIYLRRKKYVEGLSPFAEELMKEISSDRERLSLSYVADVTGECETEIKEAYRRIFSQNLPRETAAGCSLFGIHRDDLEIEINGVSARQFASQGQQRSSVLAIKLAEGEYSHALTGEYPVFLFDDVLSELDEGRRQFVLREMKEKQLILTSCEALEGDRGYHKISVDGGNYVFTHRERTDG